MTARPLNLVVPMAGRGARFRKAGFDTFKPFIAIDGKPMIRYVVDAFPRDVRRFVITSRELITDAQVRYLEQELGCTVIYVAPHQHGPAYSLFAAADSLPLDESFFVSYCDIYWTWDFAQVRRDLAYDGVVYTHSGFHPHLIANNFSAFCRPRVDDAGRLAEIREKGSFTADWMNEPVSVGAFFVRDGQEMMAGARRLVEQDRRVGGEFFPSLIFNDVVARGGHVALRPVPFYIHWGVPEQLNDFARWRRVVRAPLPERPDPSPANVMCMAGLGTRMKNVSEQPKALIPLDGQPMYRYVADRFPAAPPTLITVPPIAGHLRAQGWDGDTLTLPKQTKSQFETLLHAAPLLRGRRDFFLTSCDAFGLFDYGKFRRAVDRHRPAATIFTFRPSLTQAKLAHHHTHVTVERDRVVAVHIKAKSQASDVGLAGFFWIADGAIFRMLEDVPDSPGGEMVADHAFQHFVARGLPILAYLLDEYVHLGTTEEFLEYRYWGERRYLFEAS